MAQQMVTFDDIVDAIREALGVQSSDTNAINKIKRHVNMYYLDEVVPFKRWKWLEKNTTVVHKAYYNVGTCTVTPDSATVTLGTAPNVSLGSFNNYKFSVEGSNKVYTVSAHTAASTTVTLSGNFQEALNATATYKIWRDRVDLPTTAKETVTLWHAEQTKPVEGIGSKELRKKEAHDSKLEGYPSHYSLGDFYDPSVGDGEFESDRYRQVKLYPAITATPVTIHIDYIEEAEALDDDADEPLMPIGDRSVLYYGAGALAWSTISRNEEMADKWQAKADQKLARMAGDIDEGHDAPSLAPKSSYMSAIRRSGLKSRSLSVATMGGSSSVSLPTYLRDVTIEGATLTDDMTVSSGVTIDGRDVGADGAVLDGLIGTTLVTLTDNTTNQAAATWAYATYTAIFIRYSIKRGSAYEWGYMTIGTDGSTASYNQFGIASIGTTGVTLTADVSGSTVRLLSTTTSTGTAASLEYQETKWLVG